MYLLVNGNRNEYAADTHRSDCGFERGVSNTTLYANYVHVSTLAYLVKLKQHKHCLNIKSLITVSSIVQCSSFPVLGEKFFISLLTENLSHSRNENLENLS